MFRNEGFKAVGEMADCIAMRSNGRKKRKNALPPETNERKNEGGGGGGGSGDPRNEDSAPVVSKKPKICESSPVVILRALTESLSLQTFPMELLQVIARLAHAVPRFVPDDRDARGHRDLGITYTDANSKLIIQRRSEKRSEGVCRLVMVGHPVSTSPRAYIGSEVWSDGMGFEVVSGGIRRGMCVEVSIESPESGQARTDRVSLGLVDRLRYHANCSECGNVPCFETTEQYLDLKNAQRPGKWVVVTKYSRIPFKTVFRVVLCWNDRYGLALTLF